MVAVAPDPSNIALRLRDLTVDYQTTRAVDGVDLEVGEGELVLLLGPNGAGKTSLVNAVAGKVRAARGRIAVAGVEVSRMPPARRVRHGVALVPEGRGVLPGLTVRENLELGLRAGRLGHRPGRVWGLGDLQELFPALTARMGHDCALLSGGEMQMLAIARALASRPRVLLLDEPSLGLAPLVARGVHELLGTLNERGMTIVLVEQKALTVDLVPHATYLLRRGVIVDHYRHSLPSEQALVDLYLGGHG